MSNAISFEADETGFGLDAATARRQFWLSLIAGLAVLAAAAMIDLQPARAVSSAPNAHRGAIAAPEFVASPAAAQSRRPVAVGAG